MTTTKNHDAARDAGQTMTIASLPAEARERHELARFRRFGLEPIGRNYWRIQQCPTTYEDAASKAEQRGHFRLAARMWYLAACVSHGHGRAARYEAAAERCNVAAAEKKSA